MPHGSHMFANDSIISAIPRYLRFLSLWSPMMSVHDVSMYVITFSAQLSHFYTGFWCRISPSDVPRAATPTHGSGNSVDHGSPRSVASSGALCWPSSCYCLTDFTIGHQIAQILSRQEEQKGEIEAVHVRVGDLEGRMGGVENRLGNLENQIGGVENRLGGLERSMGKMQSTMQVILSCKYILLMNPDLPWTFFSPVLQNRSAWYIYTPMNWM